MTDYILCEKCQKSTNWKDIELVDQRFLCPKCHIKKLKEDIKELRRQIAYLTAPDSPKNGW